jgi:pSer/pThr/pTyr-binding forkhead associated (FHA) protein
MATQRLVITGSDQGQFVLLVEGDTITVGGNRLGPLTVLQHARVTQVHCVLDVEGEAITYRLDEPGRPGQPQPVRPGEVLKAGGSQLCLEAPAAIHAPLDDVGLLPVDAAEAAVAAAAAASQQPEAAPEPKLAKRLVVVDGADTGQTFPLPERGTVTLGRDRKHADFILHDLYVGRIHCVLQIDGDKVEVSDESGHETLLNGQKITKSAMNVGDVVRIGNSHIRLELAVVGAEVAKVAGSQGKDDEPIELTVEDDGSAAGADYEVVGEDDAGSEGLSEQGRLLKVWRDKLGQLTGQSFGRYKLGEMLGRGRCGVVFRADDEKTEQPVALKVFSPQFPHGERELQRFAHVVKGLLPLRHANLVTLIGAGKTGAYAWIAREYVEGESLTEVIERLAESKKFSEKRACRVAIGVARALDFGRKHRLRHGRITPANILLRTSDKAVKLADLMLGSILEGSRLWKAAQELRTPAEIGYLAPEQADQGAFVDELSDLYGLGAVVYALLTGRPPFAGDDADAVLEQVRSAPKVKRPSALNPDLSPALEKVVLKLLARRQEDRYQTAAELLDAVEPIAEELGVEV